MPDQHVDPTQEQENALRDAAMEMNARVNCPRHGSIAGETSRSSITGWRCPRCWAPAPVRGAT